MFHGLRFLPAVTLAALLPTIQGGGRMVVGSSARAGTFFQKLVLDELGVAVGTPG